MSPPAGSGSSTVAGILAKYRATQKGRLREVIARNVFWNWSGTIVEMVAGFVVAPLLVNRMGATGYGLWIVIGSLSGYFNLIDFGLRGSLGRQLAFERARDNYEGANRVLSSGLAILTAVGGVAVAATFTGLAFFHRLFDVPPELNDAARFALLLVGINLAISFPLQVFDGHLWASQRFDILNFVDIPITCLRVALTFVFVKGPTDIVALGVITLLGTLTAGAAKAVCSFQQDTWLQVKGRYVHWGSAKSLFEYGFWNFILTVARLSKSQLSPVLIGTLLGLPLVTPFSIARRLQDAAHRVLWTTTGVLIPVATKFHAQSQLLQQRHLFLVGAKFSTVVAIFFLAYFICVGESIIALWMGPAFTFAAPLLVILSAGEFLQMTQSVSGSILLAQAEHRFLALASVVESAITIALIVLMSDRFGLIGVAAAIAVPQLLFSGMVMLVHGCITTGVGPSEYIRHAVVPPVLASLAPIAMLILLTASAPPDTWSRLLSYTAAYGVVCAATSWAVLRPTAALRGL